MSLSDYGKGSASSSSYGGAAVLHAITTTSNGYHDHHHGGENGSSSMGGDSVTTTTSTTTSYQGIINSMATLSNIGNSCNLNSVVYTLRFTPNFLHNLHHLVDDLNVINQLHQTGVRRAKTASLGRNNSSAQNLLQNGLMAGGMGGPLTSTGGGGARSMSNKDLVAMANGGGLGPANNNNGYHLTNGIGLASSSNGPHSLNGEVAATQLKCNRQTATEKLHELYQNLTRSETVQHMEAAYQPVQFLNAIQDVSTTFEGNQQQDAHEFLMCILDSIRETCQTLTKSYAESSEFQRTLNGVAHMACHDGPSSLQEPSNLSTAQITVTSNATSTGSSSGGGGGAAPLKSIFNNLKRKSKRKEDKLAAASSAVIATTAPQQPNNSAKVPDIVIDSTTAAAATVAGGGGAEPSENESGTADPKIAMVNGGGGVSKEDSPKEEKVQKLESDFFSDDFEGVTVSTTKCLSCETETEQKETMIDLAIPISGHESLDSLENPQAFFQSSCITKEYFRGDNKYRCEKCSSYTEAIRSISFEVLPRLLVIQLKRFSGGMEKINSFIPTPFVLQCFCRKCCALPEDKKLHVYRLYSVITHVGATMSAGHYITYTCSLDCYCDYLDCEKEAEKWLAARRKNGGVTTTTAVVLEGSSGNGMDYDLTDGKLSGGLTNLSNPGHQQQQEKTNLIDKIKKNRLFKNKSSGIRSKFSLGSSNSAQVGVMGSSSNQQETLMNSHNELIERHLTDSAAAAQAKKNGPGSFQPQVCRSLNCCTIKAKANFLLKQVASCAAAEQTNGRGGSAADWNLYCNNPRHQAKFGAGNLGSTSSECGDSAMDGMNLTASMSSSSSSATSGSLKQQQNGSGAVMVNGVATTTTMNGGSRGLRSSVNVSDEPIWYMCDDDKIKSMPQHEFKELLSSNRKIAITPYLLFYARTDQ